MNIPQKFYDNVKKDINYQVKVSPAVIKVPITTDPAKLKTEKDALGNDINYVLHQGKWFEIVHLHRKEYQGQITEHYLIRVSKKEYPKAYPFNSFGYFVLPPELEAIYGKRCNKLTAVCFMSNDINKIFGRVNHVKFDNGSLACAGDGTKANRYNPITEGRGEVPCVCAYSRYYTDYTGEEVATEFVITPDMKKEEVYREYKKYGSDEVHKEVLVQGAWRGIQSREGERIKLKPFTDNKPPCDFNFELHFSTPKAPGMHLTKLHSTGLENYLRIKESVQSYMEILGQFGINIITQPMDIVLRVVEKKNKKFGKILYPQISIEFPQSIMQLVIEATNRTYALGSPVPLQITGTNETALPPIKAVDIETGEFEEVNEVTTADETIVTQSPLQKELNELSEELNKSHENPMYVFNYLKDKQITLADTEQSQQEVLAILKELKQKEF